MATEPTFQDLLAEFSEEIFVGRLAQLNLFQAALDAARPPFLILGVSGQGGVGKTTLLEQYQQQAENSAFPWGYVNEDQTSVVAVLGRLASGLASRGAPLSHFTERYQTYRRLKEQMEADPEAPKGALDFALRTATRIGMRTLRSLPLAGQVADVLFSPEAEDRVVDEASALASYVARKFTNKDERLLLTETEQTLTEILLADLNGIAEKKGRAILFFDTYEQTAGILDGWLLRVLEGQYGRFSGRVLFVIAGRYPLGQTWTKFRRAIREIEIDPFRQEEAVEYLHRFGIDDAHEVEQLFHLSEGLPVLLALLTASPHSLGTGVTSSAVERFLQGLGETERETALLCSVPRYFDRDVVAMVLGADAATATFHWLAQTHFVREREYGWAYHDVVRRLMIRYLENRSKNQLRTQCH